MLARFYDVMQDKKGNGISGATVTVERWNGDDATLKIRDLEAAAARSPVPIIALSGGGIGPAGTSDSETVYKAGMQGLVLNCEAFV